MAIKHSVRIEINRGRSYYVILPGTQAMKIYFANYKCYAIVRCYYK